MNQKQFHVYWKYGKINLGDYFTKHHAPLIHKIIREFFVINIVEENFTARVCCNDHAGSGYYDPILTTMTNAP